MRPYHPEMVVALLVTLVALVVVTVHTRRPPLAPVPDLDGFLGRWETLHDGADARASRLVRGWLSVVYRLARPVAVAGVQPDVVTAWTLWLALAVVALARAGGGWAVAAGVVLVISGLGDALDGAVAALTGRATAWGYVLDSVVDRLTEVLYLVAAWIAGAPAGIAIASGVAFWLLEYLRARAGNAGVDHVAVITVGERPQRIICCAVAVGLAGSMPARATLLGGLSLGVLLALSVAGLAQLGAAVHREADRTER